MQGPVAFDVLKRPQEPFQPTASKSAMLSNSQHKHSSSHGVFSVLQPPTAPPDHLATTNRCEGTQFVELSWSHDEESQRARFKSMFLFLGPVRTPPHPTPPHPTPPHIPHISDLLWMVAKSISHYFETIDTRTLVGISGRNRILGFLGCEMIFTTIHSINLRL